LRDKGLAIGAQRDQYGGMPGNPRECHLNAARCSELSDTAATPELRQAFIAAAEVWRELAAELEADQALLDTLTELDFTPQPSEPQPSEPYEALPTLCTFALGPLSLWAVAVSAVHRT
jgi:hypothetical protein